MYSKQSPLRAPDVLVLLKIATAEQATVRAVAAELDLPSASVQKSLARLEAVGLVAGRGRSRRINRLAARDFLIHAAKWIAPATPGRFALGIPTAHSAEPLRSRLFDDEDAVVIPVNDDRLAADAVKGRSVEPLHEKVPAAVARDPKLYELVALVDALRIGRARDRTVAGEELRARL